MARISTAEAIASGSLDSKIAGYAPIIFTTSHAIRQEDKAEIYFAGYSLSEMQGKPPRQDKVK